LRTLPSFLVLLASLVGLSLVIYVWLTPLPLGTSLRSPAENRLHARHVLVAAQTLQAADSCTDEERRSLGDGFGYWVQDFQILLDGPAPVSDLWHVGQEGDRVAQLYAMIGLRRRAPRLAQVLDTATTWPDTSIMVHDDCRAARRPLREVLAEIRAGAWDARVMRRRIRVH
jgi:hypothetical protein